MILYNVTVKIDKSAEQEWVEFMKNKHIPDVMATGQFTGYRLCHLLDHPEEDGATYVIQYEADSQDKLNHYQQLFAPALRKELEEKFKGRFVSFRTVMEVV